MLASSCVLAEPASAEKAEVPFAVVTCFYASDITPETEYQTTKRIQFAYKNGYHIIPLVDGSAQIVPASSCEINANQAYIKKYMSDRKVLK